MSESALGDDERKTWPACVKVWDDERWTWLAWGGARTSGSP